MQSSNLAHLDSVSSIQKLSFLKIGLLSRQFFSSVCLRLLDTHTHTDTHAHTHTHTHTHSRTRMPTHTHAHTCTHTHTHTCTHTHAHTCTCTHTHTHTHCLHALIRNIPIIRPVQGQHRVNIHFAYFCIVLYAFCCPDRAYPCK